MDFGFTEEQELLRAEVRKFLDAHAPLPEVRKIAETPEGFSREHWKRIAELGWPGLTIAEAHGGAGLGWVDLVVLLEETGRTLFPSPLVSTSVAATAIREAGSAEQQRRFLPGLADGSAIGSLALLDEEDRYATEAIRLEGRSEAGGFVLHGTKRFVPDAAAATLFVVAFRSRPEPEAIGLALVPSDAPGLAAEDAPGMDTTKRLGHVRFEGVRVGPDALLGEPGKAGAALARVLDLATAAVTAEAIGAAEGAHALVVRYAQQRTQFGSPIGRFQGVKHPLAEMYVDIESFKSLLYYAAWALDERHPDAPRAVSMAKAYASDAFARIGLDGVQLHGGLGYTWEYDAQLYLKRAKWVRPMYGDADHHYERLARLGGL